MRGRRDPQPSLFYAIDVEDRIRPDHPLRPIKVAVDRILAGLSDRFEAAYSDTGRPGWRRRGCMPKNTTKPTPRPRSRPGWPQTRKRPSCTRSAPHWL